MFTSAGRRSYIIKYFRNALQGEGDIHVANSDPHSAAFQAGDYSVITPLIHDPSYIEFLLDYCVKYSIRAIIPLFDIDLPMLSKSKMLFDNIGVNIVVSDYEVTNICNDKWKTYTYLCDRSIASPLTFISIADAMRYINEGNAIFPLVLKPRWGMGSIGIYRADDINELRVLYNRSKKDIYSTYLKFESSSDAEHPIVIQKYLSGQEYGLDVINDLNKGYMATLVKKKIAMRSGETDIAITVDNVALRELGRKLSDEIRHIGNLDVDCIIGDDGIANVLEMNCRFGGQYPFSHLAGANVPLAIIKWLKHEKAEEDLFNIRYGVMGFKDITPEIFCK